MKRFLTVYNKDKENIKMINQSETGFDLVILSDTKLQELLNLINECNENNDGINIIWQMKFKPENFVMYGNCTFSDPVNNKLPNIKKIHGKKLAVKCDKATHYSHSHKEYNEPSFMRSSKPNYKDGKLLDRMLKIDKLSIMNKKKEIKGECQEWPPKFVTSTHDGKTYHELK